MKQLILAFAAILILSAVPALAVDHPVASVEVGCPVVLMESGDVYGAAFVGPRVCPWPLGTWQPFGNMFVIAGAGTGPVIGMTTNGQVLCANGDAFQLSGFCGGVGAALTTNVFAATGTGTPGETFVTFGGASGGTTEYALTNLGGVYRFTGCGDWERVGALNLGPTATSRTSWGALKAHYR
jgi:hypothetical protein